MKTSKLIKILRSQLAKHITLVLTGNIIGAGLGFLAILMISKSLTVSEFGLFTLSISAMIIGPRLAILGMDTSMIKFSSAYLGDGKVASASEVLRVTLNSRIITSSTLAIALIIGAKPLAIRVFEAPGLGPLLRTAGVGILFIPIFNYFKAVLYAYKWFRKYVVLQLFVDGVKVSAVAILFSLAKLNTLTAVACFALAPAAGVLIGFLHLRTTIFSGHRRLPHILRDLISYSKWTFTSTVCRQLFNYTGVFMLTKMLSAKAAGIYGLAINLTYIFPIIIVSLTSVLLPEVSRFRERAQFQKYIRRVLKISVVVIAVILPFLVLSRPLIIFFFGQRYSPSVPIFNVLLLSFLSLTTATTIRTALLSLHKPQVIAAVDIARALTILIGCLILIPLAGTIAPAILTLIINIGALIFLINYINKHLSTQQEIIYPQPEIQAYNI